uniref:Uncharacterized protein n=1 Tax=Panagrolaimus superbus TaxID=310955 RepID=A0A914XY36_9BILA
MTTSYNDVQKFLAENKYPNQDTDVAVTQPPQPIAPVQPLISPEQISAQDIPAQCVAQIPVKSSHLRRYCTIFWNEKLCCANCPGFC